MKYALVAVAAAVLVALIFLGGLWLGRRLIQDSVTPAMVGAKVEQEACDLRQRISGVDAKLDILLNIATNGAARDFRR